MGIIIYNISYNILKPLDKSQIPSGILYDYVYPVAALANYDGSTQTDTSNIDHFYESYAELYHSMLNNYGKVHPATLRKNASRFHQDAVYHHPIGIIDYTFHSIDTNAISNNLLTVNNGQLYDVQGRSQSPYIPKTARIAGLLVNDEYPCLYPGQHYFTFSDDFVLSNSGFSLSQVTHLQAIFNGTSIYNASVSGLVDFTLPLTILNIDQSDVLVLILTINGQQRHYHITTCQISAEPTNTCRGTDQIEITGFPFDGGYGEGTYSEKGIATIYWADGHCADKLLRKPVIFVDGFDPFNGQHHGELWSKYLNFPYIDLNGQNRLGDELLSNLHNFDVIILDQKADTSHTYNRGGAGLIENNGLVLAKLLDTLYQIYHTTLTDDFVVVGASMGGLVTRYGLTWMEKNNKPHHTRLFISFDSPQNGAHINIGLQRTIDIFTQEGLLSENTKIKNALHQSNAAKQMLIYHSSTNSETLQAHPFRSIFLNNLQTVGNWPTQCRVVSIINGNKNGILKNITPSPNPYNAEPIASQQTVIDFGIWRKFYGINCNLNICKLINFEVFAQSSTTRALTNKLKVQKTPLTRLINSFDIPLRSFSQFSQPYNGASPDIAPGCRFGQNPLDTIRSFYNNWWYPFVSSLVGLRIAYNENIIKDNNFIPTVSSVAYTFPNGEVFDFNKSFSTTNLSKCAGTTPFDTVYAPTADMPHVKVDAFIASAFRNEVYNYKSKSNCYYNCPDKITISAEFNPNGRYIYEATQSIELLPPVFLADSGIFFLATIGCTSSGTLSFQDPFLKNINNQNTILTYCPFEWDNSKNEVNCNYGPGYTNFKTFIKNLPVGDYGEFSIDQNTWYRANIGDIGAEWLLPSTSNYPQTFYARPHSLPGEIIQTVLYQCP